MSTLGLRIEPSVVHVNDADSATVQITLDNGRGDRDSASSSTVMIRTVRSNSRSHRKLSIWAPGR